MDYDKTGLNRDHRLNGALFLITYPIGVLTMTEFEEGVLYSAAVIVELHGRMVVACDLLREAGLFDSDVSELDDYEKKALKKLNEQEPECCLTGFDSE